MKLRQLVSAFQLTSRLKARRILTESSYFVLGIVFSTYTWLNISLHLFVKDRNCL